MITNIGLNGKKPIFDMDATSRTSIVDSFLPDPTR